MPDSRIQFYVTIALSFPPRLILLLLLLFSVILITSIVWVRLILDPKLRTLAISFSASSPTSLPSSDCSTSSSSPCSVDLLSSLYSSGSSTPSSSSSSDLHLSVTSALSSPRSSCRSVIVPSRLKLSLYELDCTWPELIGDVRLSYISSPGCSSLSTTTDSFLGASSGGGDGDVRFSLSCMSHSDYSFKPT